MSNKKGKEILKVITVSALSTGIMSAAFIGINSMVFAASANEVTSLSPVTVSAAGTNTAVSVSTNIPAEIAMPETTALREGFLTPTLTVEVGDRLNAQTPSVDALSPEEAALAGAQYIWEVFGKCIDGKFVDLQYWNWPSHTRTFWHGNVSESRENFRNQVERSFGFVIDAVTGEWIDITNFSAFRDTIDSVEASNKFNELSGTEQGRTQINEAWDAVNAGLQAPPLDEHIQVVKEYARRHFINTGVVSADFVNIRASAFGLDESGNFISRANILRFNVTDSTGRVAVVSLDEETKAVSVISTMDNDVFPGFFNDRWTVIN